MTHKGQNKGGKEHDAIWRRIVEQNFIKDKVQNRVAAAKKASIKSSKAQWFQNLVAKSLTRELHYSSYPNFEHNSSSQEFSLHF